MKNLLMKLNLLTLVASLVLGLSSQVSAQRQWGDYAYDEQQWWDPGDWFDERDMEPDVWDYDYTWNDRDWYDNEDGLGGVGDLSDSAYGSGEDDSGLFDDNEEWHEEFDYDSFGN